MSKLPMNLPNRITIGRILLIPLYLLVMAVFPRQVNWGAALIFAVACVSDWVDGQLARRRNEITDFGKFMDPIADKLLILLPMIQLLAYGARISMWAVLLTTAREVIVSGFRLVAVAKGRVIAAGPSGKLKTTVQMLAVLMLTLGMDSIGYIMVWLATGLSVYSGVEILYKNRAILEEPA